MFYLLNQHSNCTYIEPHSFMELKNTIKEYRQKKKLTQEELALKVGVSRQTIISIERYRYKPSLELGMKIANSLKTKIDVLFYFE